MPHGFKASLRIPRKVSSEISLDKSKIPPEKQTECTRCEKHYHSIEGQSSCVKCDEPEPEKTMKDTTNELQWQKCVGKRTILLCLPRVRFIDMTCISNLSCTIKHAIELYSFKYKTIVT